jgi:hypothetical protein
LFVQVNSVSFIPISLYLSSITVCLHVEQGLS